jgi:3-deoxy-D-manno-octulosonate 8-phosphate phosphatase KdsC-like HAD superfamily phosphatase
MKVWITKELWRGKRAKGIKVNGVVQGKQNRERKLEKLSTQLKIKCVQKSEGEITVTFTVTIKIDI